MSRVTPSIARVLLGLGLGGVLMAGWADAAGASPAQAESSESLRVSVIDNVVTEGAGGSTTERTPVEGASISVSGADGEVGEFETDESGVAIVELPGPGRYEVTIDQDSLPDGTALRDSARGTLSVNVTPNRAAPVSFALGQSQAAGDEITLKKFVQATTQGVRFGLIIGLTAIGLSLIFGVTGLTNFAHGELVTFGAIVAYALPNGAGLPLIIAAVLAVAAGGAFGAMQDKWLWRQLRARSTSLIAQLVISIGLSLVLRYLLLIFFRGRTRNYRDYQGTQPVEWLPLVNLNPVDLFVMGSAITVLVAVGIMLQRTRLGTAMRAVADNRDLSSASGINVNMVITQVWALGAALAAFGGILLGLSNGMDWQSGARLLLLMFAGVTLGGLGTAYGALVGSVIVGLFVEVSTLFIAPELKNVSALVVLIVILVVRPQGLLGRAERVG